MLLEELRTLVLKTALDTDRMGLCRCTSGNVSARDPQSGLVCVTPSGIPYDRLNPADISVVDVNGNVLGGQFKPSSETPMHTAIYRARQDIHGVVHTHSVYATTLCVLNRELPPITVPLTGIAPVPVVPWELPGSAELAHAVARALGTDRRALLLQNHGPIVGAKTLPEALNLAVYLEEGAQVAVLALICGGLNPIPEASVAIMRQIVGGGKAV
jgi:L-fuculose-phosphate aldolase